MAETNRNRPVNATNVQLNLSKDSPEQIIIPLRQDYHNYEYT